MRIAQNRRAGVPDGSLFVEEFSPKGTIIFTMNEGTPSHINSHEAGNAAGVSASAANGQVVAPLRAAEGPSANAGTQAAAYSATSAELAAHLESLRRQECYVVDKVLKESATETTQLVHFEGANGASQGPFIRKYIKRAAGLGSAYERIFAAQQAGRRFRYIPRIYDFDAFGDEIVVVMEFVRGETLDAAIYRCDPSMALAADVFPRLCDAVSELHEEFDPPIVHRDLKPGNIMLSSDSLTIIDFGISRTCKDDADSDTACFGTRAYAPPEQFGFAQTTVRSDVYALGLLLYYCLVERVPDSAARERGFSHANIPEPVRLVIEKAAAFDPRLRYASARELKEAFQAAVRQTGFVLAQPGAAEPAFASNGFEVPDKRANRMASTSKKKREGSAARKNAASELRDGATQGNRALATSARPGLKEKAAGLANNAVGLFAAFADGTNSLWRSRCVPKSLGIAWNVVVLLLYVLLLAIAFYTPFDSNTVIDPQCPFWFVLLEYCFMIPVIFGAFAYTILDRRRLQKRFPVLARLNWWQTALVALCVSLAAIVVTYIAGMPYIQAGVANIYVNTN